MHRAMVIRCVCLWEKLGAMKQETDLLVDQIRTISKQRLMGDKPLAELSRAHTKRVEDALRMLTGE